MGLRGITVAFITSQTQRALTRPTHQPGKRNTVYCSLYLRRFVRLGGPGSVDPRHVPEGMTLARAYRWCLARTTRDLRESIRRRRPIALPTLRRLFTRRWLNVSEQCRPAADGRSDRTSVQRGERTIQKMYRKNQPFQTWAATSLDET